LERLWHEPLYALKPNIKIPFYNLRRYRRLMNFEYAHLNVDPLFIKTYPAPVRMLTEKKYDAIVVGKDIWDVEPKWHLPQFPNLFWLSDKIPSIKIAYAVSAHRMDLRMLEKHKPDIKRILNSYAVIGVRDGFTFDMITSIGIDAHVKLLKVPDPAFMFNADIPDVNLVLRKYGINPDRPLIGLLLYGNPEISKSVCSHYRSKGCQIVNFNMFNPWVDINLGHKTDPFEWAALFQALNFCVTDRFHCSIFCIKNNVPFVSVEPYPPRNLAQSKLFDLLSDFNLTDCYQNTYRGDFNPARFVGLCEEIKSNWKNISASCEKKYGNAIEQHMVLIRLIKEVLAQS
jgi:hypothetical protein